MQKSLKIVSIIFFSLILFLALFFAFNVTSEVKVLAESAPSIQINGTEYVNGVNTNPLQTAIGDALKSNEENVVIDLSGEIAIGEKVVEIVEGEETTYYKGIEIAPSGTSPKITFRITANTTISRIESNTNFTMFAITNANVVFQTVGDATLTIDGKEQNGDASAFLLEGTEQNKVALTLNGNIVIEGNRSYQGGCVKATYATLVCDGPTFQNNKSKNHGGAMDLSYCDVNLTNCIFENNIAGPRGGAIRSNDTKLTIQNCDFLNNRLDGTEEQANVKINGKKYGTAVCGGTLLIDGKDETKLTTIIGGGIQGSIAESEKDARTIGRGGAIELRSGILNIKGTTISGNNTDFGGAIAVVGGTLNIEKLEETPTQIKTSTATQLGGAIFLESKEDGIININGATISGNSADFGGAIAVLGGNLTVNDFEVSGNSATQEGGGLYLKSGTVEINGGTIKNNTNNTGGSGDIYWSIPESTDSIFSAKVETENKCVIYCETDFVVGENFIIAKTSSIQLASGKSIYVKETLLNIESESKITLRAFGDPVGTNVVYFAQEVINEHGENVYEQLFAMAGTSEYVYNLVLSETPDEERNEYFLYVSREFYVEFYQYFDGENFKYKLPDADAKPQEVEYSMTIPNIPIYGEREDEDHKYRFVCWEIRLPTSPYEVIGTLTEEEIGDYRVEKSVIICGVWGVEVKVEFEVDGTIIGEHLMTSNTVIDANTLSSYVIPTKTGYDNKYWAIEVDGEKIEYENQIITGDTTLSAVYVPNDMNITLKDENGIELLTFNVNYNATLTADALSSFPALEYDRTGYDDEKTPPYWAYEGTTTQFDQTEKITENIVLVATYFKNKYTITFKVNYKSSTSEFSDESLPTQTVEYLDTVDTLPTPNEFEGYNPANVVWDYDRAPIESNLIITGEVYINKYTVSFIANGEILVSYEKEHFETLTKKEIPAIPVKEGYTQRAPQWDKDTSSEIESNINFEAEYYLNVYTITFVLPDGTKIDRTVKHGHTVDNSNIIDIGFGEIVKYDKPLENITADGEIRVTTINLFMWIMIGVGVIVLAVSAFMIYKLVKRRRVIAEARKRHRHIGPYVTGDDEFN